MRLNSHMLGLCALAIGACRADTRASTTQRTATEFARGLRATALGCYRLEVPATMDPRWRESLLHYFATFRLGAEAAEGPAIAGRRVVSGTPRRAPKDSIYGVMVAWVADSLTDSISVSAGDLFTGVGITLAPTVGEWRGHAEHSTDAGPPFEYELGPVTAHRIDCTDTAIVAPAG